MPTVVPDVGANNANSYASVAEADAYFADRLKASKWNSAVADDKARALIQATRRLDIEDFEGAPVNPLNGTSTGITQALKWPRQSADNVEGWTFEDDVIPDIVKRATYELALTYLSAGEDPLQNSGLEGFEQVAVGPIKVTPRHTRSSQKLPDHVRLLIAEVLRTPGASFFSMARA